LLTVELAHISIQLFHRAIIANHRVENNARTLSVLIAEIEHRFIKSIFARVVQKKGDEEKVDDLLALNKRY
jgi:hypothetical protein